MIGIRAHAVRISVFLSPKTFHDATIDFRVMCRLDGMCCRFLSSKLDKSISFVLEHSYILNGAEWRERFLYQLVCDAVRETSAIYSAIGRTTLVIYLLEKQYAHSYHRYVVHDIDVTSITRTQSIKLSFSSLVASKYLRNLYYEKY